MDVSLANPLGLLALLGIPVILAIHLLQRESRRVVTTTLFLVERLSPVSAQGRRVESLRNSLPLWLQIAAVLVLALLFAQPRWLRPDSFQSIAMVLDSSVSMEAFRPALRAALERRLAELAGAAKRTEFTLTESDATRPTLYAGSDLTALLAALDRWQPRLGEHDPAAALAVARSLRPKNGVVVFATDHRATVPAGVDLLAVGSPLANVGFTGLRVDPDGWSTLVVNPTATPQTREWWVETAQGRSAPARLELAPGETRTLRGRFPADRLEVVLSADAFPLDDRLPIIRPRPKTLRIAVPAESPFFQRLAASVPASEPVPDDPDVRLHIDDPLAPAPLPAPAILFVRDPSPAEKFVSGEVIAEDHPLTRDLSWSGLQVRDTFTTSARAGDEVLVWAGPRPLIFLRRTEAGPILALNFDVTQSNAARLPAVIVLLHRFLDSVREQKIAPEAGNVELAQPLVIAGEAERAPERPGFFTVRRGEITLLEGAAHFADPREADFRAAATVDTLVGRAPELLRENVRGDFLTPWLLLALLALVLANWAASAPPRPAANPVLA